MLHDSTELKNVLEKGLFQQTFTCSNSTVETLKKRCEICSELTIKISERHH